MHRRVSGKYIRKWRTKKGLSYDDIAEALNVHPVTVRNWEKSKTLSVITRLAFDTAFNISNRIRFTPYEKLLETRHQKKVYPVFVGEERRRKYGNNNDAQKSF